MNEQLDDPKLSDVNFDDVLRAAWGQWLFRPKSIWMISEGKYVEILSAIQQYDTDQIQIGMAPGL